MTKFEDLVTHLKCPIDIIIFGLASAKKRVLQPGLGIGITLRVFSEYSMRWSGLRVVSGHGSSLSNLSIGVVGE